LKTKVLHIAPVLAGVETAVRLIAANLDETLFELVLIKDLKGKIEPITYKSGKLVPTHLVDFERVINPLKDARFLSKVLSIAKKENPDLIHCHSAKCGIIGRTVGQILSIPTFYTPHAFSYLSAETERKKRFFLSIEKLFSKTNSHVLACSESEANRAIHDVGYASSMVHVVNNALPEHNIDYNEEELNLLCTIGRPSFQKNTLFLVQIFNEAVKIDPNIKLVILGVGYFSPDLQMVKDYIALNNLDSKVKIVDWTSRNETLITLSKSAIYISTSRYEGLPFAVLEALSLGKPCILSNVDGNRDCVEEGKNGYLFDLDESQHNVAQKIWALLNDKQRLRSFGMHSINTFKENFFIDKNIKILEGLYMQYKRR
jgi:glycosyltransferase involved in cell wall biosynthesis